MRTLPILLISLFAACSAETPTPPQNPEPAVKAGEGTKTTPKIEAASIEPTEVNPLAMPDTPAGQRATLGAMLFFDARLSGSGKTSCSTCHLPELGWTDGKQFSAKDDGSLNKRHTPTLVNSGYCEQLYWDGRAPNMEKNVVAAWKGQMGGDPAKVAEALEKIPGYAQRFQSVFSAKASEETIGKALAAFVSCLRGADSAFDRWQKGEDGAVDAEIKAGYDLFLGKAGCAVCHTPPLFTDRRFHNTGIGMDKPEPDLGRGPIAKDPALNGYFKTPSLRDVSRSAPYFHDGSIATLEEAVKFMASGGHANPTRSPELFDRKLDDPEVKKIVAFLKSLDSGTKFTPPQLPQ